ncbi:MAG: thiol protease/hemagglutinin PrtT [Paludibacteraceae bacterium]|nr:thiol protease/hemagglutinin PrtT [Paludibacteraceae bacterium]
MKKLFILLFSILPAVLYAERIGIDAARQTAENFMQTKSLNRSVALRQAKVTKRKISSKRQVRQQPEAYYIFRSENGSAPANGQDAFAVTVIAAADDRLPAILGYSIEKQPSVHGEDGSLPPALEAWLDDYDQLIEQYDLAGGQMQTSRKSLSSTPDHPAIAPIITARWYQREPYNLTCPEYLQTGLRSITGCVATAMTMAMSHYRYPDHTIKAIPKYTYTGTYEGVSTKVTVPALPNNLFIDWENIVDYYDTLHPHSPAQDTAIANLMMYAGKSVKMQYTPSSSGAYSYYVATALKTYFGYPESVIHQQRESFTSEEWDQLIYNELASDRPVVYHGSTTTGGHAYIVDGYDADGYYHVNWGWGGSYDGYFLLDVLNPRNNDKAGASSTREGYVLSSGAVIGITTEAIEPVPARLMMELQRNTADSLFYRSRNYTTVSTTFDIGIALLDNNGEIERILDKKEGIAYTNTSIKTHGFAINLREEGVYQVAFVSRVSGTEPWIISPNYNQNRAVVNVTIDKDGNATCGDNPVRLEVLEHNIVSVPQVDSLYTIQTLVRNNGSATYNDALYLHSIAYDGYEHRVNTQSVFIEAGKSAWVSVGMTPRFGGEYELYLLTTKEFDEANVIAHWQLTVPAPTVSHALQVTDYKFYGLSGNEVEGNALAGNITIRNIGTQEMSYPVAVRLLQQESATGDMVLVSSQSVGQGTRRIDAGGTAIYDFDFDGLLTDSVYAIQVVYDSLTTVRPIGGGFYQMFPLCKMVEQYSTDDVAEVIVNGASTPFASLTKALDFAAKSQEAEVRLLKDITDLSQRIVYKTAVDNHVCTLDLNGHQISGTITSLLYIKSVAKAPCTFVLTDNSRNKNGKISVKADLNGILRGVYAYNGIFHLAGGTIETCNTLAYSAIHSKVSAVGVHVCQQMQFDMTGGAIVTQAERAAYGVVSYGQSRLTGGTVTVQGATTGSSFGLYILSGKTETGGSLTVNVSGGANIYAIRVGGGTPNKTTGAIYNGEITVDGGTFNVAARKNAIGVCVFGSSAQMSDFGTLASAGKAVIKGGVFNINATEKTAYGVYVQKPLCKEAVPSAQILGGKFMITGKSTLKAVNNAANGEALLIEGGLFNVSGYLANYTAPAKDCSYYVKVLSKKSEEYIQGYKYMIDRAVATVNNAGEDKYICFSSLQDAFNYAPKLDKPVVRLLGDVTGIERKLIITTDGIECTLDLNGHLLEGSTDSLLYVRSRDKANEGLFRITDKSQSGNSFIRTRAARNKMLKAIYQTAGELHVSNCTIEAENTMQYSSAATGVAATAVYVGLQKHLYLTNATLNAVSTRCAYGAVVYGDTYIENSNVNATETLAGAAYGLYVLSGHTEVTGSTVITVNGTINVHGIRVGGGTPSNTKGAVYNGDVVFHSGTVNVTASTNNAIGVCVFGKARNTELYGLIADAGTAVINGGAFNVSTQGKTAVGVYVGKALTETVAPKATINAGYFQLSSNGSTPKAVNTSAGQDDLLVQGGVFSHGGNLSKYTAPKKDCDYYVVALSKADDLYKQGYRYTIEQRSADYGARQQAMQQHNATSGTPDEATNVSVVTAAGEITVSGPEDGTVIRLYDVSGRLLQTTTVNGYATHLSVSNGVYILQADSFAEKIVVK